MRGRADRVSCTRPQALARPARSGGGSQLPAWSFPPLATPKRWVLQCVENKTKTGEEQRHGQQLAHGRPAPKKAKLGIRFAEELTERACESVANSKASDDQAGPLQRARAHEEREDDKQQQTFEPRLIKLTGVSRQRPAIRKYQGHGPRRKAAPKFPVYKIGGAAQEKAGGCRLGRGGRQGKDRRCRPCIQIKDPRPPSR